MSNSHKPKLSGVSSDATDVHIVPKPKRRSDALRALDYRKRTGGRWQRCSRCHREHELHAPLVYNLSRPEPETLVPLMVGQDLMGFVCNQCFRSTCAHIASIFPDAQGFPHVDQDGMLVPTPRCECGTALQYASDGRELLCSQCDAPSKPEHEYPEVTGYEPGGANG